MYDRYQLSDFNFFICNDAKKGLSAGLTHRILFVYKVGNLVNSHLNCNNCNYNIGQIHILKCIKKSRSSRFYFYEDTCK